MQTDRWNRTDYLLQAVLELPPGEREAYLRHACTSDLALEREVRSLLKSQQQGGSFLESPPWNWPREQRLASRAKAWRRICKKARMGWHPARNSDPTKSSP